MAMRSRLARRRFPDSRTVRSKAGAGNGREVGRNRMIARFSRKMVTENEVSSMAISCAPRIGR